MKIEDGNNVQWVIGYIRKYKLLGTIL